MTTATMGTLTPTEAAVVACVSVRDVNRTVDEKILPEDLYAIGTDRTRRFYIDACTFIAFYFKAADRLTSEERLRTITQASAHLRKYFKNGRVKEWIVSDDFLRIDLAPFLKGVHERLAKLEKARALVVEDPQILDGTPVIEGTRIPVYDIASSVEAGVPVERILGAYPGLSAERISLAALYAQANPLRGRPPRSPSPPRGAIIVSSRRIPRRKQAS